MSLEYDGRLKDVGRFIFIGISYWNILDIGSFINLMRRVRGSDEINSDAFS